MILFKYSVYWHFPLWELPPSLLSPLTTSSPTHWLRVWLGHVTLLLWRYCKPCWLSTLSWTTTSHQWEGSHHHQNRWEESHFLVMEVCYCLLGLLPSLSSPDEPCPCGGGCICGVSAEYIVDWYITDHSNSDDKCVSVFVCASVCVYSFCVLMYIWQACVCMNASKVIYTCTTQWAVLVPTYSTWQICEQ